MNGLRTTMLLVSGMVCLGHGSAIGAPLAREHALVARDGKFLDRRGRRVAFYGVNLFQSHLFWSRRQDPKLYESELAAIADAGFNAVRMPLNLSWFEPRRGVFPDSPEYAQVMKSHRLPAGAVEFYDGLIRRAGELGLYVIPEFHELPTDPYRWFVGGEERDRGTGKPGTAIAWMGKDGKLDVELARREIPLCLSWLAAHWRGIPAVAGIEIPWNEPRGPLTEPKAYTDLVRSCARAVKDADPGRLVFMDCVDWGAMVNRMPDESVWKIPDEVDALFPHFYPGMHSTDSGAVGTWSASMANWASWMAGSGKAVMVGEYGVVEMKRARYWKDGVTDGDRAATYAACGAQWYAMGLQGIFCWAWQGGIDRDRQSGAFVRGAEELPKWAAPFRECPLSMADAQIGVVCAPRRRAQYGARKDLWRVTEALLDAHLAPFATVFASQVAAQPEVLRRFKAVIVMAADLPGDVAQAIRAVPTRGGRGVLRLDPDLGNLDDVIARARERVAPRSRDWPASVIVGYATRQVTVFERKGREGVVRLKLRIPDSSGSGRVIAEGGEALFAGDAGQLARDGAEVRLSPWQCRVFRWVAAE